jgi:alpha-1,3-glucan synthase
MRKCAKVYGKKNFFIAGEITPGNTLGSVYIGRGRSADMVPSTVVAALSLDPSEGSSSSYFLRDQGSVALDAGAFHYSVYRFLTRFLGLDGNLESGYDLPRDWVQAWCVIPPPFFSSLSFLFRPMLSWLWAVRVSTRVAFVT